LTVFCVKKVACRNSGALKTGAIRLVTEQEYLRL